MRFDELTLDCYGAFETTTLHFPADRGLVVVYGPNEAGKSSVLAAIGDFLFGVPDRSDRVRVFGSDRLRIRAALRFADGARVAYTRRKGRTRTLLDEDGRPVDEATLATRLGGLTLARFSSQFGLSHESLREGGRAMMKAEGDVGQLILAAGGGLSALVPRVERLRKEADALFADRRADHRTFYIAHDAYEAAEKRRRDGLVTREQHEKAVARKIDAVGRLEAARARCDEIDAARHNFARSRRVAPSLRALDGISAQLADFDDLAPHGEEFSGRCQTALDALKNAAAALAEAELRLAKLEGRIGAQNPDGDIVAADADVAAVVEKARHVEKERRDRPNRERELADATAALAPLRARLGAPDDAALKSREPSAEAVALVRRLAQEGADLRTRIAAVEDEAPEAEKTRGVVLARQEKRIAAGRDAPLGFDPGDFADLARVAAAAASARAKLDRRAAQLRDGLARAGADRFEALADEALPDDEAIAAEIERRAGFEGRRADLGERIDAAREKIARHGAQAAQLAQGLPPASPEAVAAARAARDAALAE
uniref:AAA family ATPase n=1 Tax=Methylocella sp. TaxID=1978226 RepID=UPI003784FD22